MRNKKAQAPINIFVGFFVAFIAIILIYALISGTLLKVSGRDTATINLKVDEVSKSNVCNYDLMNFLRINYASKLTFAELLAYDKDFDKKAEDFFNNHYARGDPERENWKIEILTTNYESITGIGALSDVNVDDTCQQIIPKNNGDIIIVKLGVEY